MPPAATSRDLDFPATRWTLVQAVQGANTVTAARAMDDLCKSYWYPIYAFLRRGGHGVQDAEDLTQAFFHRIITEGALISARCGEGKLRSYLLAVLKRLISDRTRHDTAQKRGGARLHISFEELEAEDRYAAEPLDTRDPEWLFLHAWAHELLAGVREKLRAAYDVTGRPGVFDVLVPFLMCDSEPPSHREIARQIGASEAGSRILIHRLRTKFRELLREEVALTVLTPEEIPGELTWLQSVLAES